MPDQDPQRATVTLRLPAVLWDALCRESQKTGVSKVALCRLALSNYLDQRGD